MLDLFSGSGSLGLEAVSRGARHSTFVDKARSSIAVLEANIRALGCRDRCSIHQADVLWYLKHARRSFDLVFIDPPYRLKEIGSLPTVALQSGILHGNSVVVMEHSKESIIAVSPEDYSIVRRPFGQTIVLFLQPILSNPPSGTTKQESA